MRRFAIGFAALAASGALGAWAMFGVLHLVGERVTTTRLSPDETLRAEVVEVASRSEPERKVALRLEDRTTGRIVSLLPPLESPGRPEGTERLVWSKDGAWLLLVGRHFYVKEDLFLDNGDQAYFLHHLPTGRSWINSATRAGLPMLSAEQIQGIEFNEPVVLKPR